MVYVLAEKKNCAVHFVSMWQKKKNMQRHVGGSKTQCTIWGEIILLRDAHSLFNSLCSELDVFPQCFVMTV